MGPLKFYTMMKVSTTVLCLLAAFAVTSSTGMDEEFPEAAGVECKSMYCSKWFTGQQMLEQKICIQIGDGLYVCKKQDNESASKDCMKWSFRKRKPELQQRNHSNATPLSPRK